MHFAEAMASHVYLRSEISLYPLRVEQAKETPYESANSYECFFNDIQLQGFSNGARSPRYCTHEGGLNTAAESGRVRRFRQFVFQLHQVLHQRKQRTLLLLLLHASVACAAA